MAGTLCGVGAGRRPMENSMLHRLRMTLAVIPVFAAGLACALGVSGCVGIAASPGIEDKGRGSPLPFPAVAENAVAAIRHVTRRYPIEGQYAVNLPMSLTQEECWEVIRRLGDENARNLTEETKSLPILHVESVRIIGDMATVQVQRPLVPGGGPTPGGEGAVTQALEVQLRGGVQAWRVTAVRPWMLGAQRPPALYVLDGEGVPPPRPGYRSGN